MFIAIFTSINQHIVAMYTQQMRTQCFGVTSRRVLAPSISRSLVSRQSAHSCRRPASRRTGIKPQAVQAPAKRELPTKGIDYKPKNDQTDVQTDIVKKLAYVVGANANSVSEREAYQGVALSVRERLIERFNKTQEHWRCATNPAKERQCLHSILLPLPPYTHHVGNDVAGKRTPSSFTTFQQSS